MNLDLDPMITQAAHKIAAGEDPGTMVVSTEGYYTVSWTGVAGVTQVRQPLASSWSFWTQARDYACVLTNGEIKP